MHNILTSFPDLLTYSFFAPTLLRTAVALTLAYIAYMQYKRRDEIMELDLPIFGKNRWWYIVSIAFNIAVGAMLLLGYYTQIGAMLAIVGLVKGWWLNHRHTNVVILSNSSVILLIIICLSLLVTGGGAFAFDLPL